MLHAFTTGLAFVLALIGLSHGSNQQQVPSESLIHIDGSKEPHRLPEWVVWEGTFNSLALVKKYQVVAALETLHFTDDEATVVFAEADAQAVRRAACAEESKKIEQTGRGKGESLQQILVAQRDPILTYRRQTLEARDRVMSVLGSRATESLLAFVARTTKGLQVDVWSSDLPFFRLPR